ncbi:MAG: hypothetical protein V3U65_06460 [Granulosicoccaceae bacterium]
MTALPPITLFAVLLALGIGVLIGNLVGNKRGRKQRRQLHRDLNQQGLQLLEVNTQLSKLKKNRDQFARKDRVLKLTLKKLADATILTNESDLTTQALERKHFMQTSRLQVAAAEARHQAQRAAKVATTATSRLKKLEALYTQTINAPEPKSYGQGESVQVSVMDQHSPEISEDTSSRVSNRDLMRLSQMSSSNEEQCFSVDSLQSIAGITAELERTLNAAGIHRIEQLASISDRELIGLPIPTTEPQSVAARANWKSGAKEWMDQRSNA